MQFSFTDCFYLYVHEFINNIIKEINMALDGIMGAQDNNPIYKSNRSQNLERLKQELQIGINKPKGGTAQRKVTKQVIEKALNEPNSHKALRLLLAHSPVGFGNQSSSLELENLGYLDTGIRQKHIGAPVWYESKDGGSVTVYDSGFIGNDGKLQTDVGPRTTIYKNENFEQTMIYDENGKLTGGKIVIKDKVGGFTERQIDFTVTKDGKIATTE
jgi:hypothetical protein